MESTTSKQFMRLALWLARQANGDTSPNPMVGAVIVKADRVVGQGAHRRAGLPHAEVEALQQAGEHARGATLFVNLEPCAHTGRTPPCCEAIIGAGLKRVVIAMEDPNPLTNGRGIERLRRAGVEVVTGLLEEEAQHLNAPFTKYITQRMPWTVVKVAQSLDGKIATSTGRSRWISSVSTRRMAHRLRREADAVIVGVNTVLRDNPRLTARDAVRPPRPGRPIRVIVDSRLRTPLSSRCLSRVSSTPTVIATTERSARKRRPYVTRGVEVLVFPARRGRVPMRRLLRELAKRHEAMSVLIEGGGEVIAGALEERLADRLVWCIAPILIGGRTSPSSVGGEGIAQLSRAIRADEISLRRLGPDVVWDASPVYPTRR
ncbi:MAG: bifunctional diaminohydroxyphosphoribosylaminopyrimidine deaminase/5-amino-6-(5-phosphoribosylamino)uracil reductase RibD [Candidatus Omnitrophica bacterium]|nr:bifunctional diaminohydroxyphosphoribosylaminopyrimidine deaminase/5-amino-6-(5-phosphoribosylamino)uracil reductase RibD [Candidatus Omnitrophota bacterium]